MLPAMLGVSRTTAIRRLAATLATAIAAGALAACAAVPERARDQFYLVSSTPLTALDRDDIPGIVNPARELSAAGASVVPLADVELIARTEIGRDYATTGGHRALVVGTPAHCPYLTAAQQGTAASAIARAVGRCLDYVHDVARQRGQDCGCRVVALDDKVLVPPASLQFRELLATILIRERAGPDGRSVVAGLLEMPATLGHQAALRVLDRGGGELCTGRYTATRPANGKLWLDCADAAQPLAGKFRVLGFTDGRLFGVARATSADERMTIIFGVPEAEFDARIRRLNRGLRPGS